MKKLYHLIVFVFFIAEAAAQAPEGFSYQAVIRNSSGEVIANESVGVRIGLLSGSANGSVVYQETFTPTTNGFGLVNLAIGSGSVLSGDFTSIDWSNGPYFIETALDVSGGTNYTVMGTTQLMSVPYALYAGTSGSSTPGPAGTDGLNLLNGTIDPGSTTGVDGEFYINTTTNTLFGPKVSGLWPAGVSLVGADGATGPQGPAGNDGADGATGPQGPAGNDGADGATGPQGPAGNDGADGATGPQGPAGNDGADGATGPQGPAGNDGADGAQGPAGNDGLNVLNGAIDPAPGDGVDGEFYFNTTSNTLFGPKAGGSWPIGVPLIGPQGPAGNDGADGATGSQGPVGPQGPAGNDGADGAPGAAGSDGLNILNGTVDPTPGIGVDGEFYINTTSSTLFGPKTGGSWPGGVSLVGPQGPAGNDGADGATGPQGPAGNDGADGATGPQGPQGPQGPAGSSAIRYGQKIWSTQTQLETAGTWITIPESDLTVDLDGSPLMITTNLFLFGGTTPGIYCTCQPIIDGEWAGAAGGMNDPSADGIFSREGAISVEGWTSWSTTRIYTGIPSGTYTLEMQCAIFSPGSINVGHPTVNQGYSFILLGE